MGSEKLRSIRRYHIRNSRALDVARWHYHFEDGTEKEVLSALAAYQNPDGGFGHGLEPDVRSSYSSPQATLVALRILREMDFPELAASMYRHLLGYLETALTDQDRWPASIPQFNESPHAPWWHYDEQSAIWGWNPTVELAAIILVIGKDHAELYDKAEHLLKEAFSQFVDPAYIPERHELTNFASAGELLMEHRPDLIPSGFLPRMNEHILNTVEPDRSKYEDDEYIATPAVVLNSPESPYYPQLQELCEFYREHLEKSVTEGGFWSIPWTWSENGMDSDSERDWRGVLIMENMLYLHHFRPKQVK